MKILKDPTWQFVAVVVAVLALAAAVVIFLVGRPVRRLQVQILSNSPLISVSASISPQIQVLYRARPVQALSLILLRFENVGNQPIREGDYSAPIRILLSPKAEVGEVTVQETKPAGISLNPTVSAANQVEIGRTLLNPGDQAVVRILALNNDGTLRVSARIAGITELKIFSALEGGTQSARPERERAAVLALLGALVLTVFAIMVWHSRAVVDWRRRRLGLDPAGLYYSRAQEAMLSKDPSTGGTGSAIRFLGKAFSWDRSYVERAQNDPLFAHLREYDKFKAVLDKYREHERRPES
jgi:hypothetical protein